MHHLTWKGQTEPPILLWQFLIPALKIRFSRFSYAQRETRLWSSCTHAMYAVMLLQFLIPVSSLSQFLLLYTELIWLEKFQNSPSTKVHIKHQLTTSKGQTEPPLLLWRFLIPVSFQNAFFSVFLCSARNTLIFMLNTPDVCNFSSLWALENRFPRFSKLRENTFKFKWHTRDVCCYGVAIPYPCEL